MNSLKKRLVVGVGGIDPRDVRLIEIVFRHSQYNPIQFELQSRLELSTIDILLVNPMTPEGLKTLARLRAVGHDLPVISVVPRGASPGSRYAIALDRLTLQLLPTLNRVVENQFDHEGRRLPESTIAALAAAARPEAPLPVTHTRSGLSLLMAGLEAKQGPVAGKTPVAQAGPAPDGSGRGLDPAPASVAAPAFVLAEPGGAAPSLAAPEEAPISAPPGAGSERDVPGFLIPGLRPVSAAKVADGLMDEFAFRFNRRAGRASLPRVLVVDDSALVRGQLKRALEAMELVCDTAHSAEEALALQPERPWDLALVDLVLPGRNGFSLVRALHARDPLLPVVILSQRASALARVRGALAGAHRHLAKPITMQKLREVVAKGLEERARARIAALAEGVAALPSPGFSEHERPDARVSARAGDPPARTEWVSEPASDPEKRVPSRPDKMAAAL